MLRTVSAVALGLIAIYVITINWIALIRRMTTVSTTSWIPLVGGLVGMAAIMLEPTRSAWRFWWLPFVVDAGSLPGFALTAIAVIRAKRGR